MTKNGVIANWFSPPGTSRRSVAFIKVVSIILFLFSLQNCIAQQLRHDSTITCLDIKFGEIFRNDKVDLSINDSLIFKKVNLKTSYLYGLTNVWVTVIQKNGMYFIATSESKRMNPIRLNATKVEIRLRYHGKEKKFEIKLKKGKYLVFDTDRYGQMVCTQTIRKPVFD